MLCFSIILLVRLTHLLYTMIPHPKSSAFIIFIFQTYIVTDDIQYAMNWKITYIRQLNIVNYSQKLPCMYTCTSKKFFQMTISDPQTLQV